MENNYMIRHSTNANVNISNKLETNVFSVGGENHPISFFQSNNNNNNKPLFTLALITGKKR